jgi:tetratricopeptide (TPR) repeat protein
MAATVARVYNGLPPEVRLKTAIFGQNYGQAGAIDLFGPKYGLPPAISGHQSYFLWGPRGYTGESVIVMAGQAGDLESRFADVALQVLQQAPALWIWDNVEPIAGFPAGTLSAWSEPEQKELADFLRAARGTKAKFLLTSRRDERDWLQGLPARIELSPMPFDECVQMTEALAMKLGRRLDDVEDWRPLLRFTQGNPLTLTVLVGQALRDGLTSRAQIAGFVRRLEAGEVDFEDEASEGRTRSLAASLAFGFENAFTESERKQLALLHLFQGCVDVDALRGMGGSKAEWCLPEVRGLTREAGIALLDRAAEVGLLTALGGGYYSIHPALPWFFRRQYYSETRAAATRAFVEATGGLGDYYFSKYDGANSDVIGALMAEEANLLNARNLARSHGWGGPVIGSMQGLFTLFTHTGRHMEWSRLVEEIVPDFVDPANDGPLPGREAEWTLTTQYRVRLARQARRWEEAEPLQGVRVSLHRQHLVGTLAKPSKEWDAAEKRHVHTLANSLGEAAQIQREQGSAACVEGFKEALALAEQIANTNLAKTCAFNLGHAYLLIAEARDLALAERCYRRSPDLTAKEDRMGRAACLGQLGLVAYSRFRDARKTDRPPEECAGHLSNAAQYYMQALEMFPVGALRELEVTHNQLGSIYSDAGQIDTALRHYRESVRYCEVMRDHFGAGQTRCNVAITLANAARYVDAHEWAQSALRDFEACGNADRNIVKTLKLLEQIESDLRASSPPS